MFLLRWRQPVVAATATAQVDLLCLRLLDDRRRIGLLQLADRHSHFSFAKRMLGENARARLTVIGAVIVGPYLRFRATHPFDPNEEAMRAIRVHAVSFGLTRYSQHSPLRLIAGDHHGQSRPIVPNGDIASWRQLSRNLR